MCVQDAEWSESSQDSCIKIAAIDNGLAFPFKHPDEWRACRFDSVESRSSEMSQFYVNRFEEICTEKRLPLIHRTRVGLRRVCANGKNVALKQIWR